MPTPKTLKDLVAEIRERYPEAEGTDFHFDDVDAGLAIQIMGGDVHRALRDDGGTARKTQIDLSDGPSLPEGCSPVEDFFPTIQMPVVLRQQRHMLIRCRVWQQCLASPAKQWGEGAVAMVRGKDINNGANGKAQLHTYEAADELRQNIPEGQWLVFLHQKGQPSYEAFQLPTDAWRNNKPRGTKEVFVDNETLQTIDYTFTPTPLNATGIGDNVVMYGPPGTSKSFKVNARVGTSQHFRTQFHPEYTHADFVGAYRPVVGAEQKTTDTIISHDGQPIARPVNYFEFVPGPFVAALAAAYAAIDKAPAGSPPERVYLVVEEINRGDCAAIFGDVFQLLDRDPFREGRSEYGMFAKPEIRDYLTKAGSNWNIAGDGRIYIPPNMTIYATMNTCDQALFPMDSAFKRRWDWLYCPVDEEDVLASTGGIRPFIREPGATRSLDWISTLKHINERIRVSELEDKQIGPWFARPLSDGEVPWTTIVNKVLFYLWHDVFNPSIGGSAHSVFLPGITSFHDLQARANRGGLSAVFIAGVCDAATAATT
jgi:hypothetical protein